MFEAFRTSVGAAQASGPHAAPWLPPAAQGVSGYSEFVNAFAGTTFGSGIYRVHTAASGPEAQQLMTQAFPDTAGRFVPFAFDWLGRQFALDLSRMQGSEPEVMLVEPGTGEYLEIPRTFAEFHDEELVEFKADALAEPFFDEWSAAHPEALPLAFDACVGYDVPLFLGGSDTVDNLSVVPIRVYWDLCAQLVHGTASLQPGERISSVRLEGA